MYDPASAIASLQTVLENFRAQRKLVETAGRNLAEAFAAGNKLLACGNGGSAADAMHLCEELIGRYRENRAPLPAVCLNADGTALTCIGNDFGFDAVFSRQVEALGKKGDVLVGFSTGGNSENVNRAFREAGKLGLHTILLAGGDGGKGKALVDECILVPSTDSGRIQEVHTLVLHIWLEMIEEHLFGPKE